MTKPQCDILYSGNILSFFAIFVRTGDWTGINIIYFICSKWLFWQKLDSTFSVQENKILLQTQFWTNGNHSVMFFFSFTSYTENIHHSAANWKINFKYNSVFFHCRIFLLPLWNSLVIEQWLLYNRSRNDKGKASGDVVRI